MFRWLDRLLGRSKPHSRRPVHALETERYVRARKIARLVGALSYYADPHNYRIDSIVKRSSPVARDGGRRARQALALMRNENEDDDTVVMPFRKAAE